MPPKKQEQSQIVQYKPCFVLPVFINGPKSEAAVALSRPVTVKKNIDQAKIIQILKDKGLEQHILNGEVNEKGRIFVAENLKTVCDQYIASLSKPADPKKDAKKDAKKQAKKQEPVIENVIPPIQIQFQKNCNDFFVYLSVPSNPQQLQTALSKDTRFDIIVLVQQKVKPGSRKPNYNLLNNQKTVQDISHMMKQTLVDPDFMDKKQNHDKVNYEANAKKMVEFLKNYQSSLPNQNSNKNIVILSIPFLNNLSKPEENQVTFIRSFFQRLCKCTKELEQFSQWKASRKLVPMIQPIKQVITKQVQVEEKTDKNKKGGKSAEPVYETVTQTIQKRYEDQPQNIKSDLKQYFKTKKVKKQSDLIAKNSSVYEDILTNCIQSLTKQKNIQKDPNFIDNLAEKIKSQNQIRPINKMTSKCIANRLRNITYHKKITMNNQIHFQFNPLKTDFSFVQLTQKSTQPIQQLKMQFMISKFESLAKSVNSKINWNFKDRDYIENFSKEQLVAIINQQLLYDPEIFAGFLQYERKKLLILSRTNPPGRVLYHNSIFDWKVLPDFQNWTDYFLGSDQNMKIQQFFNYPFQSAGNLAIKAKNMMPADNTIIKDEIFTIGSNRSNIVQIYKENSKFGLTKNKLKDGKSMFVYWHEIDEQYRLRAYKCTKTIKKLHENEQQKKEQNQNADKTHVHSYESVDVTLANKKEYRVMMDPNPTFYWQNPQQQKVRSFNSLGSITSYRRDGSIHIYNPNAEISIYKNGKWIHFNDANQNHTQLSQGQSQIKIREDQTITIADSNGNRKVLFPDGTQLIENVKLKTREIKSPRGPFIRISLPRDYNFNVIGHGSAFAYLGFKNILERSYDGYLFQIIDAEISSHFYTERYEKDGKIKTEQVRLIAYQDGSHLKINCSSGTIVFNSPNPNQALTQQTLNERWLQTYTTKSNHGQGVFDIDLNIGHIENKDSQTNKFVAKVNDRSQAQIAVSFITQDEQSTTNVFPSGFHIKQQNYFLPPPKNFIPARLFCINEDGSGTEYLNSSQIGNMSKYSVTKQYQGVRTITQYSKEIRPNHSYLNVTFSNPVNVELFGLPDVLKTPETKQSLIPVRFYDVAHRVIENIVWSYNYSNIQKLEDQLHKQKKQKQRIKQSRKIQRKDHKEIKIEG